MIHLTHIGCSLIDRFVSTSRHCQNGKRAKLFIRSESHRIRKNHAYNDSACLDVSSHSVWSLIPLPRRALTPMGKT